MNCFKDSPGTEFPKCETVLSAGMNCIKMFKITQ